MSNASIEFIAIIALWAAFTITIVFVGLEVEEMIRERDDD